MELARDLQALSSIAVLMVSFFVLFYISSSKSPNRLEAAWRKTKVVGIVLIVVAVLTGLAIYLLGLG